MPDPYHHPIRCHECQNYFPCHGLQRPLSIQAGHIGHSQFVIMCPSCRRNRFETHPEPYPPKVEAYLDAISGAHIIPRINAREASLHYFLDERHLQGLPKSEVHVVGLDNVRYRLRMFEEKHVLDRARLEYGGDVGILNARKVIVPPGQEVPRAPVGPIRERRNLIRQAFWESGIFAAPELPFVHRFVEYGEGDLHQLVNLYGS